MSYEEREWNGHKLVVMILCVVMVLICLVFTLIWHGFKESYNNLVSYDEQVNVYKATLESAIQTRYETIPDLVKVVEAKTAKDENIISSITEAREELAKAMASQNFEAELEADNKITEQIKTLLTVVNENYPDLSNDKEFLRLMDSISSSAQKINVARVDYSTAVGYYNKQVRSWPTVIYANLLGFEEKPYFEADEAANNSSMVEFNH